MDLIRNNKKIKVQTIYYMQKLNISLINSTLIKIKLILLCLFKIILTKIKNNLLFNLDLHKLKKVRF